MCNLKRCKKWIQIIIIIIIIIITYVSITILNSAMTVFLLLFGNVNIPKTQNFRQN
jgi:hypothetical protein